MRLLPVLVLFAAPAVAQAPATVTYHYENSALTPSAYTVVVHRDGSATFQADGAASPRPIVVPVPLTQTLFASARRDHLFQKPCASGSHVAFTGQKTLSYTGPDGSGSCTFNYAKDQQLNDIPEQMAALVTTLGEGETLSRELAHDPLGLDSTLQRLTDDQANGRASGMRNIAPVLHSIADDDRVLRRDRELATALLAKP